MNTLNNMNIDQQASATLLAAFNGEQYPYAEAMEEVYVPIANIEIYDAQDIRTNNGQFNYTHVINFMAAHPNMPSNIEGNSIRLVDFRSARIMRNLGFEGDEAGFMQACEADMNSETPDCAYARVYICWRTIGENYQRRASKGGEARLAFPANPSDKYQVGEIRPFYELAGNNEISLPSWYKKARTDSRLNVTMQVEMENIRKVKASFFAKRNNILNVADRKLVTPIKDDPRNVIQEELNKLNLELATAKGDAKKELQVKITELEASMPE